MHLNRSARTWKVALIAFVTACYALSDYVNADNEVTTFLQAADPQSAERAFTEVVSVRTVPKVQELIAHDNVSLALRAAWHTMVVSGPGYGKAERLRDQQGCHRFLGFIEGRLKLSPPKWWTEALLDAQFDSDGLPRFTYADPWLFYRETRTPFRVPSGNSISIRDGKAVISDGVKSLVISDSILKDIRHEAVNEQVDVVFHNNMCLLAFHPPSGFSYPISAIDMDTGKRLWTTTVWNAGLRKSFGASYHRLSMVIRENGLFVFGADPRALYIEAFSLEDGKVHFRFTTGYSQQE